MITKKILTTMILSTTGVFLALIMSGCGDETTTTNYYGDPQEESQQGATPTAVMTGQFLDDVVEGLGYTCSSGRAGTTDADGLYTCDAGDEVSFSVGEHSIGTVPAQTHFITPYSFYPNDEDAALRLARVLQSLDVDGDPENGIVIEAEIATLLPSDLDLMDPSSEAAIEAALGITLVSREQAYAHLHESIAEASGDSEQNLYIPEADAGADQNTHTESTVTLDASLSTDVDGSPLTYRWELIERPEGSEAVLSDDTAVRPTFDPDVDGSYRVELIVDDGVYVSLRITVIIIATTANAAPVADVGDDQNVQTSSLVYLDASRSSDEDGDELTYAWRFVSKPEGSLATLSDVTAIDPTFVTDVEGDYVIALIVDDGESESSADVIVVTASTLITSPVAEAGEAQDVGIGEIVILDGRFSADSDADLISYEWSLIARPVGSLATLSAPTRVNPTFTTDVEGTYVAQLIVSDGVSISRADTVVVTALRDEIVPSPYPTPDPDPLPVTTPIVEPVPEDPAVDPYPMPTPLPDPYPTPDPDPSIDPISGPDDGATGEDDLPMVDPVTDTDPVVDPTPTPVTEPVITPVPDPITVPVIMPVPDLVNDNGNGHSDSAP